MRFRHLLRSLLRRLGLARASRPEDVPHALSAEAMDSALRDARLLHSKYNVSVAPHAAAETPPPKPANDDH